MSQSLIQQARAQALAAVLTAYSAGRKLTPWIASQKHPMQYYATTCCFEGAER